MADLAIRTDIVLRDLDRLVAAAGPKANIAIARGLNRTGTPTATAGRRNIVKVLGLRSHPYAKKPVGDVVKRRISVRRATRSNLEFSMAGFGGGLPLIYYQPREAPSGASVNWLGARKKVPRSFYLSGRFPRRKRSGISGAVRERVGRGRWKLSQPKGPGVPEAMQTPAVSGAWERDASSRLPHHMREALLAVLRGY